MIREFAQNDLDAVMTIWLKSNVEAHWFIAKEYWENNFDAVKEMITGAEIYVYEDEKTHHISGFAGLTDSYLAGIFVDENSRSKGIGKMLLDRIKQIKPDITLNVYQKNVRAVSFYMRENFIVQSEGIDSETNEKELLMIWKRD